MTKNDILLFLKNQFAIEEDEIDEETGLFSEGVLDSFSIVDLIHFIESKGEVTVEPSEVELDNLDSVQKIIQFVESKRIP